MSDSPKNIYAEPQKNLEKEKGVSSALRTYLVHTVVGYTGTRGIFGGRNEVTELSGTAIEFVPKYRSIR